MNAILLTIDSLRRDFVMSRDGEVYPDIAPKLSNMASQAVVFPNAVAQAPYTRASFASMFTSTYPSASVTSGGKLVEDAPVLAEVLKKAGYETCGIHSNPFLTQVFGFHRGFSHFEDNLVSFGTHLIPRKARVLGTKVLGLLKKRAYLDAEGINAQAEAWLRGRAGERPFFLWLHYMDTHGPYYIEKESSIFERYHAEYLWRKAKRAPASITEGELETLKEKYRMKISYLDDKLGRLFDTLDKFGLMDDSVIIMTADHGDEFLEHGGITHTRQLYGELINVPFILRYPDGPKGHVESSLICLMDIAPTILDFLNLSWAEYGFKGRSLRKLIEGGWEEPRYIISEATPDREENIISVTTPKWKFISKDGEKELYFLENDPGETNNVASEHPDVVSEMEEIVRRHLRTHKKRVSEQHEVPVDEEVKRRLRALGYYD